MMVPKNKSRTFVEDEAYFLWLCRCVGLDDPEDGYLGLMRLMYDTEFSEETAVLVGNDKNRISDGLDLRHLYSTEYEGVVVDEPCSVLEMLVAFSERIALDMGYMSKDEWFMEMLRNLRLDRYLFDTKSSYAILRQFRLRKYMKDGLGGLFPLYLPAQDQRDVELWYQMQAYILERFG